MTDKTRGKLAVISVRTRVISAVLVLSVFCTVTAFATATAAYGVSVHDGENVYALNTLRTSPVEILGQAGIELSEDDVLDLSLFTPENDHTIIIKRAVNVTVADKAGNKHEVHAAGTVSDAFAKAGVALEGSDVANYSSDTPLTEGMLIIVLEGCTVSVTADGQTIPLTFAGGTVLDAVNAAGITLGADDTTEPEADALAGEGMSIIVHRVSYSMRTETAVIKRSTVTEYSDTMYANQTADKSVGQDGEKTVVYKDKYVDGVLVRSTVEEETITRAAINNVLVRGTKVRAKAATIPTGAPISEMAVPSYVSIGADGVPANYKKVINADATAYCIPGGITSTGKKAQTGYIAVDPKEIPYGTEMWIVSADGKYVYGYCIAADTGGFVYKVDWTVDLYMNSIPQCYQWGRRDVIIYIL
ncbi:MAG: DUF348 domain-containing protein [Clostridiales bacterium]|nr:DUF348 domain-containing protein [Clostridiales bacterium]